VRQRRLFRIIVWTCIAACVQVALLAEVPDGTILKEMPFTHEGVSTEDLIMGLQQIIERAHEHGIRVFGATLTPFEGADYYSAEGEAMREAVNHQAVRIGLNHLDLFSYLGAFSPALFITDTSKDYNGAFADPTKLNQQLHLFWIGVGSDDFLLSPVRGSHEALDKAGIKHVWTRSSGAHVWTVWRKYLADFAPRLFQ